MHKIFRILYLFQLPILILIGLICLMYKELSPQISFPIGTGFATILFSLILVSNQHYARAPGSAHYKKWIYKVNDPWQFYANQFMYLIFFLVSLLFFIMLITDKTI